MTRKSTLLKVVSILMIIFGAIALIANLGSIFQIMALGGFELFAYVGINPGLVGFWCFLVIVGNILMLVAGIMGIASNNKALLEKMAIILIVVQLLCLIFAIPCQMFSWTNITGFLFPILYYIGAKQCIQ